MKTGGIERSGASHRHRRTVITILSRGRAGGRTKARAKWPVFGRWEEGETGAFPGRRRRSCRSRAHWTSSGRTFKNLRMANHSPVTRHDYSNASDRVCTVVKNEARVKRIGQPHWPAQCDHRRSERWSRCASEVNPKRARGGRQGVRPGSQTGHGRPMSSGLKGRCAPQTDRMRTAAERDATPSNPA